MAGDGYQPSEEEVFRQAASHGTGFYSRALSGPARIRHSASASPRLVRLGGSAHLATTLSEATAKPDQPCSDPGPGSLALGSER